MCSKSIRRNELLIANLISLDTETGGLNPDEHSLFEIGMVNLKIFDEGIGLHFQYGPELDLKVKHDTYHVTAKALEVNGIDIQKHHTESAATDELNIELIREYFRRCEYYDEKVIFLGHNIQFDIKFLSKYFDKHSQLYKTKWDDLVSHRTVELSALGRALYHAGILDKDLSMSNASMSEINLDWEKYPRHTALGDAMAAAKVYEMLLTKMRK